jgi:hypothetical protein
MNLAVPAPHAVIEAVAEDGARFRVRRHGKVGGPRLLISHGNGFGIDGYFPLTPVSHSIRCRRIRYAQPRAKPSGRPGKS